MAKMVIVKPRNIKAMFRYRWMANYLAVPHDGRPATPRACATNMLRICPHWSMDFVVEDVANSCSTVSSAATAASATTRNSPTRSCSWTKTR